MREKLTHSRVAPDDYVTKPFHMRELTARVRAALRRTRLTTTADGEEVITVGDLSLNAARRLVQKAGTAIHLTPKEFDLLYYLMANRGLPITHARLLHAIWGPEQGRSGGISEIVRARITKEA